MSFVAENIDRFCKIRNNARKYSMPDINIFGKDTDCSFSISVKLHISPSPNALMNPESVTKT